jgi:hypothetical protein
VWKKLSIKNKLLVMLGAWFVSLALLIIFLDIWVFGLLVFVSLIFVIIYSVKFINANSKKAWLGISILLFLSFILGSGFNDMLDEESKHDAYARFELTCKVQCEDLELYYYDTDFDFVESKVYCSCYDEEMELSEEFYLI